MKPLLFIRAVFFTLLFPGSVTTLVPYLIVRHSTIDAWRVVSTTGFIAVGIAAMGVGTLLYCIWEFAFHGKGTLAPIAPPKVLVVRGLYRFTRNPMYLAVLSILCAETLFFGDARLLWYAAIVWLSFHCFVLLYEEPHLRREFGDQYKTYCERVPRWWIAVYPFEKDGGIS